MDDTLTAQEFAALQRLTPAQAVAYLQRRSKITLTYGWQDLWQDEHAQQFTISRLARADLLQAVQDQITKSVQGDLSRRDFLKDIKKLLQDEGWWGQQEVIEPATGEILKTTFNPTRLKLIFDTNTRMAAAAGQWESIERTQRSHPYVRYITQRDDKVRPAHKAWDNVVLPVGHTFWHTHTPPNGWRCRCRIVAVSQREYDQGYSLQRPGVEFDQYDKDGKRTKVADLVKVPFKKDAPDVIMRDWLDKRSGQVRSIPAGIDPGFGYNPGMARAREQSQMVDDKLAALSPAIASAARAAGLTTKGEADDHGDR
ncbi:MAG: phage minor head protein [Gammaproteobacteria bacterium]|nr:phage minor head protein [Gammaproteobacteria bacterium]